MRRDSLIPKMLREALHQAAENLQSLKMVRPDEVPDLARLKSDLLEATSSSHEEDYTLLPEPFMTGNAEKPKDVPGEIEERIAASNDKLSRIMQHMKVERTRMRDQFEITRQNRLALMATDLDVGLTLAKIAECSSNASTRSRNQANARVALNTIAGMLRESTLTKDEQEYFEGKIADLRAALKRLAP